jgi:hypothetical protein
LRDLALQEILFKTVSNIPKDSSQDLKNVNDGKMIDSTSISLNQLKKDEI